MNTRIEVRELSSFIQPYRNHYITKTSKGWIQKKERLTDEEIFRHCNGESVHGYYGKYKTDYFALDIDLHGTYLNQEIKNSVRYDRYKYLTDFLGQPSLVSQSSKNGGLHVYYKFNTPYFYGLIKELVLRRLRISEQELKDKFKTDILPTPRQAIAFPHALKRGGYLLNPETFKVMPYPEDLNNSDWLNQIIKQAKTYTFTELFQDTPESIIIRHYKTKTAIYTLKCLDKLDKTNFPIPKQGETNKFIGDVCFRFYQNGMLDPDIIFSKIQELFRDNKITLKSDTRGRGLLSRIKAHLRRLEKGKRSGLFIENYQKKEVGLFDIQQAEAITEYLTINYSLGWRLKPSMIKFVTELIRWERYIRELSTEQAYILDIQYKYFYHRVKKQKLTPLPKVLMIKWNERYFNLIEYLKQAEILKHEIKAYNPYKLKGKYSEIQGTCNYYRVNLAPKTLGSSLEF